MIAKMIIIIIIQMKINEYYNAFIVLGLLQPGSGRKHVYADCTHEVQGRRYRIHYHRYQTEGDIFGLINSVSISNGLYHCQGFMIVKTGILLFSVS